MRADAKVPYDQLPARQRRRLAVRSLLRSLLVSAVIVTGYFLLPMSRLDGDSAVVLAAGLGAVTLLLGWQIREIARSAYPRIRGVEALATSIPLFLTVFATTYYLLETAQPASFSEPLNRLDAMYFTVTVFATVGFGDIVAKTELARTITIVQMLGDLLVVGVVAKALLGAVQAGLRRKQQ